ncbi:MAG: transketolase [Oligoflexia bacterium]|nr:transketolase [Oligoflexia bacterium]
MKLDIPRLEKLALTIRMLSADGVEKANSGHPGMPMGAADYAAVLWANFMQFNPAKPDWLNRDRFVLSAGHGSMLLYSLLHLFGYDLPLSQLQSFRQWESKTPGHPEFGVTSGVEVTTGPLGQGLSNGVGLALSGKLLQQKYSAELFDYRVYGIVSDGDLMEGVASEAASFAGHLKLDNLIYFYDDNQISIGGDTDICFTEDVGKRFEAYGWNVQHCSGHDLNAIAACLEKAKGATGKPSLIVVKSTIGFGSPNRAGTSKAHGEPLGKEELKLTKEKLGWPQEPAFLIPKEVGEYCCALVGEKEQTYQAWNVKFESWKKSNPQLAAELGAQISREIPASLKEDLLAAFKIPKKDATRNLSGEAIQVIAKKLSYFIGGSADLEPSTKTLIKGSPDIQPEAFSGRNIRFGVREHGMGAVANGLAYCRCWLPYTATFLVFADYMRPTIRLAALSHLQTLFIFTHDSFWVGEDGPTHEPIEQIASLRIIPNLHLFRPADGMEVAMCYYAALGIKNAPSTLLFTRQNLPPLERPAGFSPDQILQGAYTVCGESHSDLVLIATGSEVWVAVEAAKLLAKNGTHARVVSMPCMELFLKQDQKFREKLIPPMARLVTIEAGSTAVWDRVAGSSGLKIGIDHYGASAPGEVLAEKFGFTPEAVAKKIAGWL